MVAVLFDMDGTLIDSLGDIAASLDHVLAEAGLPTHPLAAYRTMVGDGASELVRRALPHDRLHLHDELLARYKARYRTHLIVETRPFDGIEGALAELERHDVPKAVLTNKPHAPAVEIVERLLGRYRWAAIEGQKDGVPHKPDPTMALGIARAIGVDPERCFFVGDTDTDMKTACNAGMIAIGCAWGLRGREELLANGARVVIEHPRELLPIVLATPPYR